MKRKRYIHGTCGRAMLVAAIVAACSTESATSSVMGLDEVAMAKGGGGGGTSVSVTVAAASPGLSPAPDAVFSVTISPGGFVELRPACSSSDRVDLQGMGGTFDALGTRSTCNGSGGSGFMFLKPLANLSSPVGAACDDADAPEATVNGWNFGVTSRYFFQVDGSDADTKFDDQQYTLVLKDCWVHAVPLEPGARRVTAGVADLYAGQSGTPVAGFTNIPVMVDLTIRP